MGRILAIDFGTRRVGAAISDPSRVIASPLETYVRTTPQRDAAHYRALVADEGVERIVVGLPLHTGGGEGESAVQARAFGRWLADATGRPVVFYDERYTSLQAEDLLITHGVKRKGRKARIDRLAAQILLQAYLDAECPEADTVATPLEDRPGEP
jgi:putative Holliday junction resolvase